MTLGRPSDYKEEYCEQIIEFFQSEAHLVCIDKEYYKPTVTQIKEHYKKLAVEQISNEDEEDPTMNGGLKAEKHKVIANRFPTVERFCHQIGIHRDTLHERANGKYAEDYADISLRGKLKHPTFSDAYKRAVQIQEAILVENALQGTYNPQFSIFMAKNRFGYKDKTEVDSTVELGDKLSEIINEAIK